MDPTSHLLLRPLTLLATTVDLLTELVVPEASQTVEVTPDRSLLFISSMIDQSCKEPQFWPSDGPECDV